MLKYYVSRYMDIRKCAEIKALHTCLECGGELEAQHVTDFNQGCVLEFSRCSCCKNDHSVSEHWLQ